MSIYRCAMCGSSKIVSETKQEGYNKKKGILGAVLFGKLGALAGTDGNTVTYYHCGDCGAVLNRTMSSIEKETLERYLASPDTFKTSLKSFKERYKNIEWDEKQVTSISEKLTVSDIEERIIEYMKKKNMPVRGCELSEKQLGIPYPVCPVGYNKKEYDNYISVIASIEGNMRSAIQNLRKRGIIKHEKIGNDVYYILVTDIEEMKELALKENAGEIAQKLVRTNKYKAILSDVLADNPMTREEIYNYLKNNGYLSEDVIKYEKENAYIPLYFTEACIRLFRSVDYFKGRPFRKNLLVCENDRYRLKNAGEIEKSDTIMKQEINEEILNEVNTIKPLIIAMQIAKKPITVREFYINEQCKKYDTQTLAGKLRQLVTIGIVDWSEAGYSLPNISQEEIEKTLFDAISNKQIHGFRW